MKNKSKVLFLILCILFASFTYLSVGRTAQAEEVRLGVIVPLTGGLALDGKNNVKGIEMAVDQINRGGGVLGRKIQLMVEDGGCNPDQSRAAAEKLITKDKVHAIIGAFCSTSTLATKPVAEKYGIPMLTGVSTSPKLLEKPIKYFFRQTIGEKYVANASAKLYVKKHNVKSVCILAPNDDWGRNATDEYKELMKELGVTVSNADLYPAAGETNYAPFITKMKRFKPDGLVLVGVTQPFVLMVKQLHEQGLKAPILGMGGMTEAEFIKLAGPLADGIIAGTDWAPGIQDPLNIAFCQEFARRYPEVGIPGKFPAAGYDAVYVLSKGVELAGGTDPEKMVEAMGKMRMDTIHGKDFHFDENHRGMAYVVAIEIEKGNRKILAHIPPE